MRKVVLSFCVYFIFFSLARADLYWSPYSKCTSETEKCNKAKAKANAMAISNYDDIEHYRDTFRKQQEADSICTDRNRICAEEEAERQEAERQRERQRSGNNLQSSFWKFFRQIDSRILQLICVVRYDKCKINSKISFISHTQKWVRFFL